MSYENVAIIGAFLAFAAGLILLIVCIGFIISFQRPTNAVVQAAYERGFDVLIEPAGQRGYWLRTLSALFAVLAIFSFIWAEFEWDFATPRSESVGIGTSGYALVLYARSIALGCISGALAILSHGDLVLRWMRITYAKREDVKNVS
ncbi:hypothetical protein [Methylocystis sp.]|uniref:hypothetical protein n=1 Tax=Methylocystis sp. TaxID=1911079 RepID=UPI003D0E1061